MKRVLSILLAVVFFLFPLGLLLIKLFSGAKPAPSAQQTNTAFDSAIAQSQVADIAPPEELVRQCYAWYVEYSSKVQNITYEQLVSNATIQRCFTPEFIASWKIPLQVSNTDPIFISEDVYPSWLSAVHTRLTSQLSQSSTVDILLGTGTEQHLLTAGLIRNAASWQINSVTYIEQQ